jgi:hypothetical protein
MSTQATILHFNGRASVEKGPRLSPAEAKFIEIYAGLRPEAQEFMRTFLEALSAQHEAGPEAGHMPSGKLMKSIARQVTLDPRSIAFVDRIAGKLSG